MVATDLSDATSYYDEISTVLGNRFRGSVRPRLRDAVDRPESFGCIHGEMRVAILDGFPYVMLLENRENSISILGMFHAASDQKGWFDRSL